MAGSKMSRTVSWPAQRRAELCPGQLKDEQKCAISVCTVRPRWMNTHTHKRTHACQHACSRACTQACTLTNTYLYNSLAFLHEPMSASGQTNGHAHTCAHMLAKTKAHMGRDMHTPLHMHSIDSHDSFALASASNTCAMHLSVGNSII